MIFASSERVSSQAKERSLFDKKIAYYESFVSASCLELCIL